MGGDFEEEQHVDPFEEHRVDSEEVTRQHGVGLGGQELLPGRSRPSRRRVDAGLVQDLSHRAGRDLVAEADEFTVDPAMAAEWVLRGYPQHQLSDLCADRWSS